MEYYISTGNDYKQSATPFDSYPRIKLTSLKDAQEFAEKMRDEVSAFANDGDYITVWRDGESNSEQVDFLPVKKNSETTLKYAKQYFEREAYL